MERLDGSGAMDKLRVEYFAAEKKVKVWINAVLIKTIDVENVMVIETDFVRSTLHAMYNVGG